MNKSSIFAELFTRRNIGSEFCRGAFYSSRIARIKENS
jgi:hypothetical protein